MIKENGIFEELCAGPAMRNELHTISAALKELRVGLKKTQRQIADELDVSHSYICKIETGDKRATPAFLLKISGSLEIDPMLLLLRAGFMQLPGFATVDQPKNLIEQMNETWVTLTNVDQEETVRYMRYLLLRRELQVQEESRSV